MVKWKQSSDIVKTNIGLFKVTLIINHAVKLHKYIRISILKNFQQIIPYCLIPINTFIICLENCFSKSKLR